MRVGVFADPHVTGTDLGVQQEKGPPTIAENARQAINTVNPDYVFGLGDLVGTNTFEQWKGYRKWIEGINAPVFDVMGGHDRGHSEGLPYGTRYFTYMGRTSATKVFKTGNNVFILLSQERSQTQPAKELNDTVNDRQFEFLEHVLSKYSPQNNVFLMMHNPLNKTVAYSVKWFYLSFPPWIRVSERMKDLLNRHEIDAHMSGHIHTKYSWRDEPGDPREGTQGVENVGKFVRGRDINRQDRRYPPLELPENYFTVFPTVDWPHGPWSDLYETGAVYYFDIEQGRDSVDIITRDFMKNEDVETYRMQLRNEIDLGDEGFRLAESLLSLRRKENLIIQEDDWFEVPPRQTGKAVFSKAWPQKRDVTKAEIDRVGGSIEEVKYQGSEDGGDTWSEWQNRPPKDVNAVKLKTELHGGSNGMTVRDIAVEEHPPRKEEPETRTPWIKIATAAAPSVAAAGGTWLIGRELGWW